MIGDIYARKSTADLGRSVGQQEVEGRDAVAAQGWEVGRVFTDDNRSASRYAKRSRPDYEALLAHIESGSCDVLVMWEASRGARRETIWFAFLELCRDTKTLIHVVSHDRTYDLSRRGDWKSLANEGVEAADESAKISERSRRGKRAIALAGKPAGRLLYGYTRTYDGSGRYLAQVEHPEQADVVRRIAKHVAAGGSLQGIAYALNREGVPTRDGKSMWRGQDMRLLVMNPAYIAKRVHQGQVIGDGDWPAILDEETHFACCARLSEPGRRLQRGTELKYFLSAVPACGKPDDAGRECGGIMRCHLNNGKRRYECVRCKRIVVGGVQLENYIREVVFARLAYPDALNLFQPVEDAAERRVAGDEAQALRDRLDAHYDAAATGTLTAAGLAAMEARLVPMIEAAEAKVRKASTPPALRELADVDIVATWDEIDVRLQREVVKALMRITILPATRRGVGFTPDRVRITRLDED